MKKLYLAGLVSIVISQMAAASVITDARSAGSGGIGLASGDYTHSNLNPALLTRFQNDDDAYFKLGVAAQEKDFNKTADNIEDFQNFADEFQNTPNQINADKLINSLNKLENAPLNASVDVALGLYVPSKTFGFGISITSELLANGAVKVNPEDTNIINDNISNIGSIKGINPQNLRFDPATDLKSTGLIRAAAVTEAKLNMAHEFALPLIGNISIGISPKFQRVDTYIYEENIYSFEPDNFNKDNVKNDSGFNLDMGLQSSVGPLQIGLVAKNLISQKITVNDEYTKAQEIWNIKPLYTAGVAVQKWGITLGTNIDLNKDKSFVLEDPQDSFMLPRQWARIGLEIDMFEEVQLRAGYKKDLANNYADKITAGLGISPFDLLTIDLAGQYSDDDDLGAAVQLGFKF